MTTTVVYADETDGQIASSASTWALAKSGTSLSADTAATTLSPTCSRNSGGTVWAVYEAFVQFVSSGIGTDTVSAAVLSVYKSGSGGGGVGDLQARLYDWGAALTTVDWVAGDSLSGLTLLAHVTSGTTSTYVDFTDDALAANINGSGATRMLVCDSVTSSGGSPVAFQNPCWPFNSANPEGTTQDPKLTITHEAGSSDTLVQPGPAAATVATATPEIVAQNWPKATGADLRSPLLRETRQLDPQGEPAAALWRAWLFGTSGAAAADVLVQPGPAAATVGTATPEIVAQNWPLVQPAAAAVTIAGVTPTVAVVLVPVLVQPAAAAITITAATPAVVGQNWPRVQPAAAAITVATATPAVVAQDYRLVQPAAASIAIGTATPAVSAVSSVVVQPAAAAITVGTATPSVLAGIRPAPAALAIVGVVPNVSAVAVSVIQPDPAVLSVAMASPAIAATQTYVPAPAAVAVAGATPAITAQDYRLVQPDAAGIAIGTGTPTVVAEANVFITPGPLGLTFTGAVPLITGAALPDLVSGGRGRRRRVPEPAISVLADDEEVLLMLYAA